jgi:hypothetical protein
MLALALKKQGVDGRVKRGHDAVSRWVIAYDRWYKSASYQCRLHCGSAASGQSRSMGTESLRQQMDGYGQDSALLR